MDWLFHSAPSARRAVVLSEEHRLIRQTAAEFVAQEVAPALDALERKDWSLARRLLARAGELGLLGADVPEHLGGVGLDKTSAAIIAEEVGAAASFAMAFGAQTGLSILPLLCFGTDDQRARYLPRLLDGSLVAAYCLSESGSGSDALAARTHATRLDDGSFRLSGEKLWITNGGFADVFVVFAKVDGRAFSAFLVERAFGGVTNGPEEHKMGLHGSSTTAVVFNDVPVPASNLIGTVGEGHRVAFTVLNYGRFKLAATCSGAIKAATGEAVRYAQTRRQFEQPLATFGAIRHKLAEMAVREYALESALYLTAGRLDARLESGATLAGTLDAQAFDASLLKVFSSETLDFVVDELVQIHGGNGFVRDYPAERRYRDARVNRIFEGTNEINRLLVPTQLLKRAQKGLVPLEAAIDQAHHEWSAAGQSSVAVSTSGASPLATARATVDRLRTTALVVLARAASTHGAALAEAQEVVMGVSDLLLETFVADSAVTRAEQARLGNDRDVALHEDAATVFVHDAALRALATARTTLESLALKEDRHTAIAELAHVLVVPVVDTVAARRRLADAVVASVGYPFR